MHEDYGPSDVNDMENDTETMDTQNGELIKNVGNSDKQEFVENSESVGKLENVENVENLDNVENVENLEDPENVQDLEKEMAEDYDPSDVNVMENVEDVYDKEITDTENVELLKNVANSDNLEFVENSESIGKMENVDNMENPDNVENVDNTENPDNVENVENMENPENVKNLERVRDVIEESNRENFQGTENNLEVDGKRWPGWPGETVFRMLIPVQRIGCIIGHKGEIIKKICEETKASIKILDGPPGTNERIVLVSAKEEPDLPLSPAMEGLLTIHKRIIDEVDQANVTTRGIVCTRLLVAAAQAGHLIGRKGYTIKSIKEASNCNISVFVGENQLVSTLPGDRIVEVQGESSGVHKAVELIASLLRRFLVDRSIVRLFEMQMRKPNALSKNMPPSQHWGAPQWFPVAGGGPGYVPSLQYMPPPHPLDTYYPPGEISPKDKPPRRGCFSHGRDPSMRDHVTNEQPHQSLELTKVTHHMQIPLSYADTVIGTAGSNISSIRRSSGATITVQETRGGEMQVEITGSASQAQAAEQLIQSCINVAANNAHNAVVGSPRQGYNPYPSHDPLYGSAVHDSTGNGSHAPSTDYGSVYRSN